MLMATRKTREEFLGKAMLKFTVSARMYEGELTNAQVPPIIPTRGNIMTAADLICLADLNNADLSESSSSFNGREMRLRQSESGHSAWWAKT